MKILVTGVNGQLGYDVVKALKTRKHDVYGSGTKDSYAGMSDALSYMDSYIKMDITDREEVEAVFARERFDVVIHCAAWTAVDKAEEEELREAVMKVNGEGTANIARMCKKTDTVLIYISTDYVFDKCDDKPIKPDDKDFCPVNYYGMTKLAGENAVSEMLEKYYIVRVSWVYGINGNNFVKTMLSLSENHDTLKVVDDQTGSPTYTADLAWLLVDMAEKDCYGYYNVCNTGDYISWYKFACEIFRQTKKNVEVIPVSTKEYGVSKAKRPANSRFDTSKLTENGFVQLPDWKDALNRFLKEMK